MAQQDDFWLDDSNVAFLSSNVYSNEALENTLPPVYDDVSAMYIDPANLHPNDPSFFSADLSQVNREADGPTSATVSHTDRLGNAGTLYSEANPSTSLDRRQLNRMAINSMNMISDINLHTVIDQGSHIAVSPPHDFQSSPTR